VQKSSIKIAEVDVPGMAGKRIIMNKVRAKGLADPVWRTSHYEILVTDADGVRRDTFVNGLSTRFTVSIHRLHPDQERMNIIARQRAYELFWRVMNSLASWTEDAMVAT
jgi:hypothetical protein